MWNSSGAMLLASLFIGRSQCIIFKDVLAFRHLFLCLSSPLVLIPGEAEGIIVWDFSSASIPEFTEIWDSDNEVFILNGRKRGFNGATVGTVSLKELVQVQRKDWYYEMQHLTCAYFSRTIFYKRHKFILGQRGSFTIRNQSTADKEHVRTSVMNTFLKFKADPLETSWNVTRHINLG